MDNYKPNSHKSREEQKEPVAETRRVEKVVNGGVRTKKKNEISKFADVFLPEDMDSVKSHIVSGIIIPAVKKAILNVVETVLDMDSNSYKSSKRSTSRVSYRDYYDDKDRDRRPRSESRVSSRFDYDEIVIESRGDAEAVLDQLDDLIERYGYARVLDLYDAVELTPPYTSNKYGWTDLRGAKVVPVRDGFVFKLPRALPLD